MNNKQTLRWHTGNQCVAERGAEGTVHSYTTISGQPPLTRATQSSPRPIGEAPSAAPGTGKSLITAEETKLRETARSHHSGNYREINVCHLSSPTLTPHTQNCSCGPCSLPSTAVISIDFQVEGRSGKCAPGHRQVS